MDNILIVYHKVDFDGIFGGLTVKKWCIDSKRCAQPTMLGYNYGDEIPNVLSMGYNIIILVDISFPKEIMKALKEWKNGVVVWIDHHVTAINDSISEGYTDLEGSREIGTAACELAWKYFFPDNPVPEIIKRLSTYDVWDYSRYDWNQEVLPLQSALKLTYGIGEYYIAPHFEDLINITPEDLEKLLETGRMLNKYDAMKFRSAVKRFGFPITVANGYNGKIGGYKGIAIIGTSFTSLVFDSVKNDYDVYCVCNRKISKDGTPIYSLSLYSEPNRINLNLGEYLRAQFGKEAGGHASAAGAVVSEEAFMKLIKQGII